MTSTLSVYYSPWHYYPEDEEYIRRLDPAWVRIHQPSARSINLVQQAAPQARIMLRSWDIDDHNGDRKREMYGNPKAAAHQHIDQWGKKLSELESELKRNNWPYDKSKWYMGLVNEPDPNFVKQVVEYSLEAMWIATANDYRLGVVASSVGTFSKPSENDRGWALCKPLEKPINDGGHILLVHEYWQPEGPSFGEDAGNLAWRHHVIPLNVPILIAESGANGYIYQRHSANDDAGWQKFMNADQYAAQVKEYIEGCDQRVQGVCLYMLDFHSDQWWSFNTGPAREQLLAIKDARPQVPSPFANKPIDTHLPSVGTGKPTTLYVIKPLGANVREQPAGENVLTAIPYGEAVQAIGLRSNWVQVRYRDITGWIRSDLLGPLAPSEVSEGPTPVEQPPAPTPTLMPAGILDPLVLEAIVLTESNGSGFLNLRLKIRLEGHLLTGPTYGNPSVFARHFSRDSQNKLREYFRRSESEPWIMYHESQEMEWHAFEFARSLDEAAALRCISMGAGQVMGFNAKRVGYGSPKLMFEAFSRGEIPQMMAVVNYCLSDPDLVQAIRDKDWNEIVQRYNGKGLEHIYTPRLLANYQKVGGKP